MDAAAADRPTDIWSLCRACSAARCPLDVTNDRALNKTSLLAGQAGVLVSGTATCTPGVHAQTPPTVGGLHELTNGERERREREKMCVTYVRRLASSSYADRYVVLART